MIHVKFCVWSIILLAINISVLHAKIEVLQKAKGLSNDNITGIVKSREGLMWVGTANGLNMYDGYHFTRPYHELSKLVITHLAYQEAQNTIWVGTDKGLYAIEDGGNLRYLGATEEWKGGRITALLAAPGKAVYVAYQTGEIAVADPLRKDVSLKFRLRNEGERIWLYARDLAWETDSSLLFCTYYNSGLFRVSLLSGKVDTISVGYGYSDVPFFTENYGDTVFIAYRNYLSCMHRGKETEYLVSRAVAEGNGWSEEPLLFDIWGRVLYVSYGPKQLMSVNLNTGQVEDIAGKYPLFLKTHSRISCVFMDEEGILWVGTTSGIIKIQEDTELFEPLLRDLSPPATMRGIIADIDGSIWAGGGFGLYYFSHPEGVWERQEVIDYDSKKIPATPFALLDGGDGYIYVASHFIPFYRFDKKRRRFEIDFYSRNNLKNITRTYALCSDGNGVIWIGSNNGLVSYHLSTGAIVHHRSDKYNVGRCIVRHISRAASPDLLWVSTDNGVFLVHTKKGVLKHMHMQSDPALSNNDIFFAEEDAHGQLWMGTNGSGINIIDLSGGTATVLNKGGDGICSDIVYGMLSDGAGNRWFSTYNGLSRYNETKGLFSNYYISEGLNSNEFNQSSFFRAPSGKMYFGGVNGIVSFYPEQIPSGVSSVPRLFVTPVSGWAEKGEKRFSMQHFRGEGEQLTMYSSNAPLVFNLGLSDYRDPEKNSFSYRIRELSGEWVSLQGNPVIRLGGMPHGRYTIQVKAMSAGGTPSANELLFHLVVKQPIYKTWWFYPVLFLIAGGMIVLFFYVKLRNMKALERLRLQIASDLHDDVGSLLTEIALFSGNLSISGNVGEANEKKLDKIVALSRDATSSMSDILWAIDVRNDFPGSLSDRIREHAEEVFLPANIELHFSSEAVSHKQKMSAEIRQQIYLIFREAVHNIMKHARATRVDVSFHYDQGDFHLKVMNDGVEKCAPDRSSGQGLKNMKMRAAKAGAAMSYECGNGRFSLYVGKGGIP